MDRALLISLRERLRETVEVWPPSPNDAVFDLSEEGHFEQLFLRLKRAMADFTVLTDDDHLAVTAAMALVAEPHMWPPDLNDLAPLQLHIEEIVRLIQCELPNDPTRHLRAAEFVIAYLHGWRRPLLDWNSTGWDGVPELAKKVLQDFFFASVHSCVSWMKSPPAGASAMGIHGPRVIGWPRGSDPSVWAEEVYERFINRYGGCICWQHLVGIGEPEPDPESLRGNAKTKMLFHLCFHRVKLVGAADVASGEQTRAGT